jgi:hypothetical protein
MAALPSAPVTVRNVWSASMAVRREPFEAVGGFRVGFAPRGDGTGLEDTDLCLRMGRSVPGRWVCVPDAVVDHRVPAERTTVRYLVARCFREGRGKIEMARLLGGHRLLNGYGLLSQERHYLGQTLFRAVLRELVAALRGRGVRHAGRAGVLLLGMVAAVIGVLVAIASGWRQAPGSPGGIPAWIPPESPVGVPK